MSDLSVTVAQPAAFTEAQWQELEYQALIFKYIRAGVPVPPYLLLPISQNLHLGSSRFLHPSSLAYAYCGRRIDSEPGRCRRTDGKKWRCSKDAHPDSKYCERHMNRSRNRSRKLVESQTASHTSASVASEITAGGSSVSGTFAHLSSPSLSNCDTLSSASKLSAWPMESTPYGVGRKEYRSLDGLKCEFDANSSLPALKGTSTLTINSNMDTHWRSTFQLNSDGMTEQKDRILCQSNFPGQQMFQAFETVDTGAVSRQQQQQYFLGREFGSPESMKQADQYLHPLFDEWPNQIPDESSSAVQLSMSTAPDPFSMSGHSPNNT